MEKLVKHTRQDMFSIIEEWEVSGLKKKEFCSQKGIGEWIFYYWQKQYRSYQTNNASGFIPIQAKVFPAPHAYPIAVCYPNGVRLELPGTVPLNQVMALIRLA